jgi:hypothetical protein
MQDFMVTQLRDLPTVLAALESESLTQGFSMLRRLRAE